MIKKVFFYKKDEKLMIVHQSSFILNTSLMKRMFTKVAGLMTVWALSALIVAPNVSHAEEPTCRDYNCVSVVREKANKFYVTKKVFDLTNDFISKVEKKAVEKYAGLDNQNAKDYQIRIYTQTSTKFLEISNLLLTEDFAKSYNNATRLSRICYDLAQIFKIRAQIAQGTYNGGNFYYDKFWKFEKKVVETADQSLFDKMLEAAQYLKEGLDNNTVVKNSAYEDGKKFYDENEPKLKNRNLPKDDVSSLTKGYNDKKDALSFDGTTPHYDNLLKAAEELKKALNNANVEKNSAYDNAKKFYDENEPKLKYKGYSKDTTEKMTKQYNDHKNALSFKKNDADKLKWDTMVAGEKIDEFRKELEKRMWSWYYNERETYTVQKLISEVFDWKVASGYRVDASYIIWLAQGASSILADGQSNIDFTKYLASGTKTITPILVWDRAEEFDIVHTKVAKFLARKIVGYQANGSETDTSAMWVLNNYFKGYFDKADSYYGFAPFENKAAAQDFINEQKIGGGKVFQIKDTGKYAVVFSSIR